MEIGASMPRTLGGPEPREFSQTAEAPFQNSTITELS